MIAHANNGKKRKRILKMWRDGYLIWRIVSDCSCTESDVAEVVADQYGIESIEMRMRARKAVKNAN